MDYISPERNLEGTCRDPGPLFADQGVSLLEHMDYSDGGISQCGSGLPNEGILADPTEQLPYQTTEPVPFMNAEIPCDAKNSNSSSPASPLKQAEEPHVHVESEMQNNATEQSIHDFNSEALEYDSHSKTEVIDGMLPPKIPESGGNGTSNFQSEIRHSDAYLGDSLLTDNISRYYQLNNSGADDKEILNSSTLTMENENTRKSSHALQYEKSGMDDQMNGGNSSPHDELNKENSNSEIAPSRLERRGCADPDLHTHLESTNCTSTSNKQMNSPSEKSSRLENGTPPPDRSVSLLVQRSPHTYSSEKAEPQPTVENIDKVACSQSPQERKQSRSPEKHGTSRKRVASCELSPHARHKSAPGKEPQTESQHADQLSRRRSASPWMRASPKRKDSPRKRDSPRRTNRSKSRSPSRKTDTSRHRREHGRSRSRSPHSRDHSRRSRSPRSRDHRRRSRSPHSRDHHRRSRSPHSRDHRRRSRSPHPRDHHRRSPRRRYSPRRRSPSTRHHSPRRPWSPPANRKTGLGKPGRDLFVAGFSYVTTERDLEKKFSRFGRVTDVRIVRDKRSGDSRGFGFLSLARDEDADEAIRALDETEWNGRIILVEKSKTPLR